MTASPSPRRSSSTSTPTPGPLPRPSSPPTTTRLVKLADTFPRIVNYNVSVAEEDGKAVFLHKVVPGRRRTRAMGFTWPNWPGSREPVIDRASRVLEHLENGAKPSPGIAPRSEDSGPWQMSFFSLPADSSPVIKELAEIDIASMTPRDAILKLYELQEEAKKGQGAE